MNLTQRLINWLPKLDRRIWILVLGRLLSQMGSGFVLFYAPIFFVNQVGLSAALVGVGLGSESVSGVVGRVLGGSMADSPRWGRRKTLLLSAAISAMADLVLAMSHNFPTFLAGNLLMGMGVGLYWPASEALVADLAPIAQRNETFAINRLADSLGLSLGVALGGGWIALTHSYRALFWVDSLSFVVFFAIVLKAITETVKPESGRKAMQGWSRAVRDRLFQVYVGVNILFTTYLALITSTLPLYFTNFVTTSSGKGFSAVVISGLFVWHVALSALCQLPVARRLNAVRRSQALMVSAVLWAFGFLLVRITGTASAGQLLWAGLSLAILAIATVSYTPAASSLVIELAPESMRGIYLSINSLCWAAGYFIGPIAGGWALDQSHGQSRVTADGFWLVAAASVVVAIGVLRLLDRMLQRQV